MAAVVIHNYFGGLLESIVKQAEWGARALVVLHEGEAICNVVWAVEHKHPRGDVFRPFHLLSALGAIACRCKLSVVLPLVRFVDLPLCQSPGKPKGHQPISLLGAGCISKLAC